MGRPFELVPEILISVRTPIPSLGLWCSCLLPLGGSCTWQGLLRVSSALVAGGLGGSAWGHPVRHTVPSSHSGPWMPVALPSCDTQKCFQIWLDIP